MSSIGRHPEGPVPLLHTKKKTWVGTMRKTCLHVANLTWSSRNAFISVQCLLMTVRRTRVATKSMQAAVFSWLERHWVQKHRMSTHTPVCSEFRQFAHPRLERESLQNDWEARRGFRVTFALKKQKLSEKNGMGRCYLEHDIVGGSPLILSLLRTALLQSSGRGVFLGLSDWGLDLWLGSYSAGRL